MLVLVLVADILKESVLLLVQSWAARWLGLAVLLLCY